MIPEEIARKERLYALQQKEIETYPAKANRTHDIREALDQFDDLFKSKEEVTIAGRMRAIRKHGGLSFISLQDASETMQVVLHRDTLGAEEYISFHEHADVGDFFEFSGTAFLTKKGQQSIDAISSRLLTKSILPLPEKWHGLTDTEKRYRHRSLDLISNPSVMNTAKTRASMVASIRTFLQKEGFTEVETPILQPIAGGANARPFTTHHNTLHADFYLRIAPELYLKRLIVGGFEKIYEYARCFRNEGISPQHNPEFTQIELYWAYATIEDLMNHLERMLSGVIKEAIGSHEFEYQNHRLSFKTPLKRLTFRDIVFKETGIDLDKANNETLLAKAMKSKKIDVEDVIGYGELADYLYKGFVRPNIIQPTFVTQYPSAMKPLAKRVPNTHYSASAQLVIAGMEVWNAFNEQNDPIEQEEKFKEQEALRERGSEDAQRIDQNYLKALKHGMPPTAGYGLGIDRLASILTNATHLKEVILFPTLKPKSEQQEISEEQES
jgi:lysyl-tRNA synthetase, class II